MIKKLLIGFAVILALFAGFVAMRPDHFRVERSEAITAAPEIVFAHVNDLQKFQEWNPWKKLDPSATYAFEGPSAGPGAVFRWNGNHNMGVGSMTILESVPNERIAIKLEYLKPFKGVNDTEFKFRREENQTIVNWTNSGRNNFFVKAMCIFMDMDKMIGDMFEQGLADLKAISEAEEEQMQAAASSAKKTATKSIKK